MRTSLFSLDVPRRGVIDGHVHFSLSSASEDDVALVGMCASVVSSLLFEKLGAQGTNLIMSLTSGGGTADVVVRSENDGLALSWPPGRATPEELDAVRDRLRSRTLALEQPEQGVSSPEQSLGKSPEPSDDVLELDVKRIVRIP